MASIGINPRGLEPQITWQPDVTHCLPFGEFKFIHVSIDTFSRALHASALTGKSRPTGLRLVAIWAVHKLKLVTDQGIQPDPLKISYKDGEFNTKQASVIILQANQIVERAHHTFKTLLNKQKRRSQETSPRNRIMLAMYTYNFLNCNNSLNTPIEKHFNQQKLDNKGRHPLVLYRDPLTEGK